MQINTTIGLVSQTLRPGPGRRFRLAALALLVPWPLPAAADRLNGPDPYAPGYGFDRPEEAEWGGWTRGAAGTLYAEWDVFRDDSHGAAKDRSAAPDVGSSGTTSAWLGWNAGTFITGTLNLYSFTVPETFDVHVAGTAAGAPLRVALQVESQEEQGQGVALDPSSFLLNGAKPRELAQTFRKDGVASPVGPVQLVQRRVLWDVPVPPADGDFVFAFSSKGPHLSLTQVAVDIGPPPEASPPPAPTPPAAETDRTVFAKLPAEELPDELVAALHDRRPTWFPAAWPDRSLTFAQRTAPNGARITRTLKGTIKALYYRTGTTNRVLVDIYRPDASLAVKIAECRLRATQRRRWTKLTVAGQAVRLGTAVYRLELKGLEYPLRPRKNRLVNRFGGCDVQPGAAGWQTGVPELKEGDYGVFRRADG